MHPLSIEHTFFHLFVCIQKDKIRISWSACLQASLDGVWSRRRRLRPPEGSHCLGHVFGQLSQVSYLVYFTLTLYHLPWLVLKSSGIDRSVGRYGNKKAKMIQFTFDLPYLGCVIQLSRPSALVAFLLFSLGGFFISTRGTTCGVPISSFSCLRLCLSVSVYLGICLSLN